MSTDRLKAKIAALRAKTTRAGCTEGEALAAAELAARLMEDHGLTEAELVMTEARSREKTATNTWRTELAHTIAWATSTALILLPGEAILFMGRAPGPEIAAYLRDVCVRAVETELKAFKASRFYKRRRSDRTRRAAGADFATGMTQRLRKRIMELFGGRRDPDASKEAHQALALRFPGRVALRDRTKPATIGEALFAGWDAGDRVTLEHGVATEAPPAQLEFAGKRR